MSYFFSQLAQLELGRPLWLLLAFLPLVLWLVLRWLRQRNQQLFADAALLPWIQVQEHKTWWQRFWSRDTAYVLAWILLALALSEPRIADDRQRNQQVVVDVMVVVDLSASMRATDIAPSRLRRATLEVYEFLAMAKNSKVGVIVYAARPHVFVPLTTDQQALQFYLQGLDSLVLPTEGSDAVAALQLAKRTLLASQSQRKQAVIWLTDGDFEPSQGVLLETAVQQLAEQNITTSILGLATPEGGAIPAPDGGWLESEGQGVVSRLNVDLLTRLSDLGGGVFTHVDDSSSDWLRLYRQGILASLPIVKQEDVAHWRMFYGVFLLPAILLLIIAWMPFSLRLLKQSLPMVLLVILLVGVDGVKPTYAADLYASHLQQGVSAYNLKHYVQSKQLFINAVLAAKDDQQRGVALHNLGNALFQIGDYTHAESIFADALRYLPEQQKTQSNLHLTTALNQVLAKRHLEKRERGGQNIEPTDNSVLVDLPDQLAFMIPTKTESKVKSTLPKLPAEQWQKLLARGLQHLQLVEGFSEERVKQQQHEQNVVQAKISLMNLEAKSSNALWKRLFEIEEGFPAKLQQPEKIPGVLPW